jgi:rhamnosyltransferase
MEGMRTKPNVAVLMATYNGQKHIKQQIDSILSQTDVNVYLYIRDDNSTDTTVDIVSAYTKANPNVFLLESKPFQLLVTKNFYSIVGEVDLSGIDYMAYADQDDIWLENKLSAAVHEITVHKVECYASNLMMGDAEGNIIARYSPLVRLMSYLLNKKSNRQKQYDHYFEAASAGCTLVLSKPAALYFQKRVKQLYDALPVDTSHDWSTYAITKLNQFKWFIDSNSYIIYRQHTDNAYGGHVGMGGIKKLVSLFTSGWYRKHILMIDDLYNESGIHPDFIQKIREYNISSLSSRWKLAIAIYPQRRKWIHRVLLFCLVLFGYFK